MLGMIVLATVVIRLSVYAGTGNTLWMLYLEVNYNFLYQAGVLAVYLLI